MLVLATLASLILAVNFAAAFPLPMELLPGEPTTDGHEEPVHNLMPSHGPDSIRPLLEWSGLAPDDTLLEVRHT